MKRSSLLAYLLLICYFQVFAQTPIKQNPLIGSWMYEADANGLKELKIITPTHVIFMVMNVKADTFAFAGYGTYSIKGNKYTENIEIANFTWDKSKKLQFDYKVEGDKFYQKGELTNTDGTKEKINHVFTRVKMPPQNLDVAGTWELVSSQENNASSSTQQTDNTQMKLIRVINPTHYMQIGYKPDGTFVYANAGTHKKEGDKVLVQPLLSSTKDPLPEKIELTYKVEGDNLIENGITYYPGGKQEKWSDTLKKVKDRLPKENALPRG
ncbi:MAG: hypothetical protein M3142_15900 [Bacteroidota bacterium]|nr:hypothetical protein [Bacteroidota bacterium]